MLRKGEHWATMDPEQLDIERRSLEVDQSKQQQLLEKGREDLREAHLRMMFELHEAEGKRGSLEDASRDPEISVTLRQRAAEAIKKLDERISLLREKLDPGAVGEGLCVCWRRTMRCSSPASRSSWSRWRSAPVCSPDPPDNSVWVIH